MHAKVIQIEEEPVDGKHVVPIDALDLDAMNYRNYDLYGTYIFDYSMNEDEEEYLYDLKGFTSYLKDNNYATLYFSDNILDKNNCFTVSDVEAEHFLEEEPEIDLLGSPSIYVARRLSTYDVYRMYSLYEWMKYIAEEGKEYFIGPIMDVHN